MIKVGLTGGIGSGKTTIARIFETLGIPVYNADDATKRLMNSNPDLKTTLIKNFGEASYKNNVLDTTYLAGIVFNDPEKLALLNSLTHPVTIKDAADWISKQSAPYAIKEAALLFESGAADHVDYVIGVFAPQPVRIKRVMDRDGLTAEEVMKRISRQMDEEVKMKRCDFVITNNEHQLVIPQVLELDKKLRELASR
ncbi:MAG: dephospho-CoA kinase [Chitinophagaceae bacterium]|nr:dephospho-CoA kinase [Chitinophagaceae bacterium]MBK9570061.1 dephospho-CoA kinase [Chitinophagaceae bacterium]MBL0129923.1 dephospho-CoA kinase [Chitinophagaceae bacterium]MBL0273445.1 dephospho-CoA kinase [Chitinophagaceae bacterium]